MRSWSKVEVEIIVADYLKMLSDELKGIKISKSEHRRKLLPLLNSRSEGSIEFKHQNISAVLTNLGQPYIKGYIPLYNYQSLLEDVVIDHLTNKHNEIERDFKIFSDMIVSMPNVSFNEYELIVDPPNIQTISETSLAINKSPIITNYLEREQNNQKLGKFGEELVVGYEKWYLVKLGKEKLAEKIEWISRDQGDGAGFDILSKDISGKDKFIEVKTTKLAKETPFYFTRNELQFSIKNKEKYYLYRLFNFNEKPQMFIKNGDFQTICGYFPIVFKGYF
jgi:hypothetical protein